MLLKKSLLILPFAAFAQAANMNATGTAGLTANVLGQSGKITISNSSDTSAPSLTVAFVSLQELDTENKTINDKGHSFNSFATQDFTFSALNTSSNYEGIAAGHFNFSSTLVAPGSTGPNAKFLADVYLIQENGNITNGDETIQLSKGDLKFNVHLSGWSFCNPCTTKNQVGSSVMLTVDVTTSASKVQTDDLPSNTTVKRTVELGGGATMTLSTRAKVDGNWTTAPVSVSASGNKLSFDVKLPKFTNEVVYDPVLSLTGGSYSGAKALKATVVSAGLTVGALVYLLL